MFPWLKSACNDSLIFASPFDSTHNGGLLKSFVVLQAKKVIAPANCNAPSSAELYGPISLRQARYGNYITAELGTRERCSFVFDVSARCRRSRKYRGGLVRAMLVCFWGVCKMYKIKKVQARACENEAVLFLDCLQDSNFIMLIQILGKWSSLWRYIAFCQSSRALNFFDSSPN